jgi:membrane protein YqaA with SNARE-associated domain
MLFDTLLYNYLLLFLSAFIAATFLPFYSEAWLYLLLQDATSPLAVAGPVLVATAGNVLGACLNWWLGRSLLRFAGRRWFYFSAAQIARAQTGFQRYGLWTLLFSWLPVVGDPLTLIAGVLRVRFGVFLLLVAAGKLARYAVVAWLAV